MKFRVLVERAAADDIVAYAEWIVAQGAPDNGSRWLDGIEAAIESLHTMPGRCVLAPESDAFDQEIRQLLFKSHRILFVIVEEAVHVLHVRYGGRLPLEPRRSSDEVDPG